MKKFYTSILFSLIATSALFGDEIGLNLGGSISKYSQSDKDGAVILGNAPGKYFKTVEVFYLKDSKHKDLKYFLSGNYGYNSDLKHQYILAGVNRYYDSIYTGLLVGYGRVTWKYDPINDASNKDKNANSPMFGFQAGYDFSLSKDLSLGLNSKFLFHNYKTHLEPTSGVYSRISHKYTINYGIGLKYSF